MAKELTLVKDLPHVPGWVALSQREKEWLQEHTSNAKNHYKQAGISGLRACAEIAMVERFIDEHGINKERYFEACFETSARTLFRWVQKYKEMKKVKGVTDEFILYLAEEGIAGMQGAHTGEIVTAFKQLPNLIKSNDPKEFPAAKEKLAERMKANRSARSKGRERPLDPEEAAKASFTFLHNILKRSRLNTSKEQISWLSRMLSYVMEERAISGELKAKRTAPPDGWKPQLGAGRPRLKARKARKIAAGVALVVGGGLGYWWLFLHHVASSMAAN